jgi:hypothetical protein
MVNRSRPLSGPARWRLLAVPVRVWRVQIAGRRGGRAQPLRARAVTGALTLGVALVVTGCGSSGTTAGNTNAPPIVTAEQVVTTCFHNYFYNGILPESAAKANCMSCVTRELRRLRIQPSPGETELDVLTGVRLSSAASQTLQNACTESDASSQ